MDINFKNLDKIDEVLQLINLILLNQANNVSKKWLSVKELSMYIDYSTDRIHKLKNIEFFEGTHYYKRSGKLLFDKDMIDKWVIGIDSKSVNNVININETVTAILDSLSVS